MKCGHTVSELIYNLFSRPDSWSIISDGNNISNKIAAGVTRIVIKTGH